MLIRKSSPHFIITGKVIQIGADLPLVRGDLLIEISSPDDSDGD